MASIHSCGDQKVWWRKLERRWKEDDDCYSCQSSPQGRKLQGFGKGGHPPYKDSLCGEYPTSISVYTVTVTVTVICLAGFAGVLGERGSWSQ